MVSINVPIIRFVLSSSVDSIKSPLKFGFVDIVGWLDVPGVLELIRRCLGGLEVMIVNEFGRFLV